MSIECSLILFLGIGDLMGALAWTVPFYSDLMLLLLSLPLDLLAGV